MDNFNIKQKLKSCDCILKKEQKYFLIDFKDYIKDIERCKKKNIKPIFPNFKDIVDKYIHTESFMQIQGDKYIFVANMILINFKQYEYYIDKIDEILDQLMLSRDEYLENNKINFKIDIRICGLNDNDYNFEEYLKTL